MNAVQKEGETTQVTGESGVDYRNVHHEGSYFGADTDELKEEKTEDKTEDQ